MASLALVLYDSRLLSRRRRLVEAEDLDRRPGLGVFHLLATIVMQSAHLAPGVARDDGVAYAQRSSHDEHRCDRAPPDVQAALDDGSRSLGLWICCEFELGVRDEENPLDEVVEALVLLGGDIGVLRRPAPLLRLGRARRAPGERALDWRPAG